MADHDDAERPASAGRNSKRSAAVAAPLDADVMRYLLASVGEFRLATLSGHSNLEHARPLSGVDSESISTEADH